MSWFVYMIQTQKGMLYTGITNDLPRRWKQHQTGNGAKFFSIDPPKEVVYVEVLSDRSKALKTESAIKKMKAPQKAQLIARPRHSID